MRARSLPFTFALLVGCPPASPEISPAPAGGGIQATDDRNGIYFANLPNSGLLATFDTKGVELRDRQGLVRLGLTLSAHGRGHGTPPPPATAALSGCPSAPCAQDLTLHRGDSVEWWRSLPNGLQQGWILHKPPPGAGLLTFTVEVAHARILAAEGGEARLLDAAGAPWTVGGLSAWDATGQALPIGVESAGGDLRFSVDDRGAAYPIQVDPLYTTAATTLVGDEGFFSFALSASGDFNGDGYDDALVSSYGYTDDTGRVYVYYGGASGISTTADLMLHGDASGDQLGYAIGQPGDFNGDGYDDACIGAPGANQDTGLVRVLYGGANGLSTANSATLYGERAGDSFGFSLGNAGDVDGDGDDELVVGADAYAARTGRVYLFAGGAAGISTTTLSVLDGTSATWRFGSTVAGGGDINGDGYGDVLVGAPSASSSTGAVLAFYGASSGLSASNATTLTGEARLNQFGKRLMFIEDLDGDGCDEVLISAHGHNTSTGKIYLYTGSAAGISTSAQLYWLGSARGEYFGYSIGQGDLDGDGYTDLVVGSPRANNSYGEISTFYGGSQGFSGTPTPVSATITTSAQFGAEVSVGDLNGDGRSDLLAGAPAWDSNMGRALFFTGDPGGLVGSVTLEGLEFGPLGDSFAAAGDVNGDGFGDLLVGSYPYANYQGRVYLLPGSADGVSDQPLQSWTGESRGDWFGISLAATGDVNGDGLGDVIVGASGYNSSNGRAYLFLGEPGGAEATPSSTYTGTGGDSLGRSSDGAGDVNGDGYQDLVVGEPYARSSAGAAHLLLGGSGGPSPGLILYGPTSYDYFGHSVAGVGDTDGDGFDDVLVGAYSADNGYGQAFLYAGSAAGLSGSPAHTLTGDGLNSHFGGVVASAGDLNGDGFADFAVGAYDYSSGRGRAYIYQGSPSGPVSAQSLIGQTARQYLGQGISGVGDINSDGFDDLVIGSPGRSNNAGAAYLLLGTATGVATTSTTTLSGSNYSQMGAPIAGAGDINGDGFDDVAIGAPSVDEVLIFYGYASDDEDGDGHTRADDCNDYDAAIYPGATEICDIATTDEDCDGLADDDDPDTSVTTKTAFYTDADGDGFGDPAQRTLACLEPAGTVTDDADCNDSDATIRPGATEREGDEIDSDCDGQERCLRDFDGDGVRDVDLSSIVSDDTDCQDAGEAILSAPGGDCDDRDPRTFPGAPERAGDGLDEDCDSIEWCFLDYDGDGARSERTTPSADLACDAAWEAPDYAELDCDDMTAAIHPGAEEGIGDAADQDCDGAELCFIDSDGDGYRVDDTPRASADLDCAGAGEADGNSGAGDCDDRDARLHPNAPETCDGVDEDCDGLTDEESTDAIDWAPDQDGDGWTVGEPVLHACSATYPYAPLNDPADCADQDPGVHPGQMDLPGDGVDQDCTGADGDFTRPLAEPDPSADDGKNPCGCASAPSGSGVLGLAAMLLFARRRP